MTILMSILGVFGAFLCTLMYVLLERGKVNSDDVLFYVINGLGAFLILISLAYDFDSADLGGVVMELSWVGISIMGTWKALKKRKSA